MCFQHFDSPRSPFQGEGLVSFPSLDVVDTVSRLRSSARAGIVGERGMKCRKREGGIFVAWSPTPPPIAPFLLLSALFHFQSLLAEIDRKNGGTIGRNGQQKSFSIKDGGRIFLQHKFKEFFA